jgi:endonuclease I
MKRNYFVLLLLSTVLGFAQVPTGYYDSATGTGYVLKTQLKDIISNDNIVIGTQGYANLYITYQTSDRDYFYENDGTILDMYSEKPSGADAYNFSADATQRCSNAPFETEGICYNREHIIPQSIFNELSPMRNDAHFVTPTDGKVNNFRNNYPHGVVGELIPPASNQQITNPTTNGSKLGYGLNSGYAAGYSGIVFEPIDEFKGDIARMYFYFATKYQEQLTTWGKSYPMFNGSKNQVFTTTFKNILLQWHLLDPVSDREIARNNAIFTTQGIRNPFIDHPEYVDMIWNSAPDTENPTAASNLAVTGTTSSTVSLSWTAGTDNIGIASYDIYVDGILKDSSTGLTKTISGLTPSTTYSFYVIAKDFEGNVSPTSNSISGTTTAITTGGGASDLFFSEYVEGSGSNKVLEIANFTGAPVDLSIYSLKKQSNGAGAWLAPNLLSGTLNNGAVFVAVDVAISNTCYALANANISYPGSTQSSPTGFNGNDPIGLFKNDVLIDIIGTFNGGNGNFAQDQTLRRKPTITAPNVVFNKALEWDQLTIDTCNNIGTHAITTLSTIEFTSDDFKIAPNPSNGNFDILFDGNEKYSIEIYSSIGQKVYDKKDIKSNAVSITSFSNGIYLVKFFKDSRTIVKKIVIN